MTPQKRTLPNNKLLPETCPRGCGLLVDKKCPVCKAQFGRRNTVKNVRRKRNHLFKKQLTLSAKERRNVSEMAMRTEFKEPKLGFILYRDDKYWSKTRVARFLGIYDWKVTKALLRQAGIRPAIYRRDGYWPGHIPFYDPAKIAEFKKRLFRSGQGMKYCLSRNTLTPNEISLKLKEKQNGRPDHDANGDA